MDLLQYRDIAQKCIGSGHDWTQSGERSEFKAFRCLMIINDMENFMAVTSRRTIIVIEVFNSIRDFIQVRDHCRVKRPFHSCSFLYLHDNALVIHPLFLQSDLGPLIVMAEYEISNEHVSTLE